jgi:hypothetical protein
MKVYHRFYVGTEAIHHLSVVARSQENADDYFDQQVERQDIKVAKFNMFEGRVSWLKSLGMLLIPGYHNDSTK